MLTKKQYLLLMFIDQRLNDTGVSPSFDEMKDALELKSKSGIHRLITGLEERGFIRRLPHRARALEVLKLPENAPIGAKKSFMPTIVPTNVPASSAVQPANDSVELPFYGKIAAGNPVEALRDPCQTVNIPPFMLGRGEHYALEIDGDSMIDAGIYDGDTVVIERCDTAESGAIVVALVDRTEVTLKRLRKKGDSIALEPANKEYETRIFGPDRVNVQGKLVGLLRQY
ncbi:MAG: repressor LexA [Rhodospirillaceae bacterium TMED167]|nr:repressor LexA [Rhodospirillaceae bacterium]OUW31524.1 MAG: repressor LexA [Rhodospirillaceae bacterium TMED167]